jgi:hypothetical protein
MQLSPLPQSWTEVRILIFGVVIGLIPQLITRWLDRKKSSLDHSETSARTKLAEANAQSVAIRDGIATGEGVSKMLTTLIDAGDTIRQLQDRVFDLEQENLRFAMTRISLKKAKALLDYHEIPFSEADQPEVKKLIEKGKSK